MTTYYAKVVDGIVIDIIIADQAFIDGGYVGDPSQWYETTHNARGGVHYDRNNNPDSAPVIRKNYAYIGGTYDANKDAFIDPQPFPSFTLNEETCTWVPPIPYPDESKQYYWDESVRNWVEYNYGQGE
jgi:hypothetical protein